MAKKVRTYEATYGPDFIPGAETGQIVDNCMECPHNVYTGKSDVYICRVKPAVPPGPPPYIHPGDPIPEWCPLEDANATEAFLSVYDQSEIFEEKEPKKKGLSFQEFLEEGGDRRECPVCMATGGSPNSPCSKCLGTGYVYFMKIDREIPAVHATQQSGMSWTIEKLRAELKEKDEKIDLLEDNLGEFENIITSLTNQNKGIRLESGFIIDSIKKILSTNKKLRELDTEEPESSSRKLDI